MNQGIEAGGWAAEVEGCWLIVGKVEWDVWEAVGPMGWKKIKKPNGGRRFMRFSAKKRVFAPSTLGVAGRKLIKRPCLLAVAGVAAT